MFVAADRMRAIEAIRRDFRRIRELGFTGVMLQHLDPADRRTLLDLTRQEGLRAVWPVRWLDHYILTGVRPAGCGDERALVDLASAELANPLRPDHFALSTVYGRQAQRRAVDLRRLLEERRLPYLTAFRAGLPALRTNSVVHPGALAVIDVDRGRAATTGTPLERWLSFYHEALMAGRTAGLLLDRYRTLPGDTGGLVVGDDRPGLAELAALKRVLRRAHQWGRRLYNAVSVPILDADAELGHVVLTALVTPHRRFVLIFNRSPEAYARGNVMLPETIGPEVVARLVEVPGSPGELAGRLIEPLGGRAVVSVVLRPGDATLFEVF